MDTFKYLRNVTDCKNKLVSYMNRTSNRRLWKPYTLLDKLLTSITQFIQYIQDNNPVPTSFVKKRYSSLMDLRLFLSNGDTRLTSEDNDFLKQSGATLFNVLQFDVHVEIIKDTIRSEFTEFIQAVTMFKNHKMKTRQGLDIKPRYHRVESCGSKSMSAVERKNNYNCKPNDEVLSHREHERRSKLIVTCYVERLIYNEFFKHTFGVDDVDIPHRMHERQKLDDHLMSCIDDVVEVMLFRNAVKKVHKVEVLYFFPQQIAQTRNTTQVRGYNADDKYVTLQASQYLRPNVQVPTRRVQRKIHIKEVYKKTSPVSCDCKRLVYDRSGTITDTLKKIQTFDVERKWIRVR